MDSFSGGRTVPRPLSLDIRERVIARVEGGFSRRETAEQFDISPSAAIKLMQHWSATGSAAAKPTGGSQSPLDEHKDKILAILAEKPDLTLSEATAIVSKRVIKTSLSAIWRFCERHKVTFKKNTPRGRTGTSRRGGGKAALDTRPRPA
jgi:transposase